MQFFINHREHTRNTGFPNLKVQSKLVRLLISLFQLGVAVVILWKQLEDLFGLLSKLSRKLFVIMLQCIAICRTSTAGSVNSKGMGSGPYILNYLKGHCHRSCLGQFCAKIIA